MMNLFKSKQKEASQRTAEEEVMLDIQRRAMINSEARRMAEDMLRKSKAKTKVVSIGDAIKVLDQVLDKVVGYENSKITAVTECLLALESGDTKNLIEYLKKSEVVKVKTKKKKSNWESN